MQVDYGPDATEQLRSIGRPTSDLLELELRSLFDTRTVATDFQRLALRHEPPWWWVRLNRAYAAIVRLCSPAELAAKGTTRKRLLVGFIFAAEDDLREVEERIRAAAPADEDDEDGGE